MTTGELQNNSDYPVNSSTIDGLKQEDSIQSLQNEIVEFGKIINRYSEEIEKARIAASKQVIKAHIATINSLGKSIVSEIVEIDENSFKPQINSATSNYGYYYDDYEEGEDEDEEEEEECESEYSSYRLSVDLESYGDMSQDEILEQLITESIHSIKARERLMSSLLYSGFNNLSQNSAIKLMKSLDLYDQTYILDRLNVFEITDEKAIYDLLRDLGVKDRDILDHLEHFKDSQAFNEAFPDIVEKYRNLDPEKYDSFMALDDTKSFVKLLDMDSQKKIIDSASKRSIIGLIYSARCYDASMHEYIIKKVLSSDKLSAFVLDDLYSNIRNFNLSENTLKLILKIQEKHVDSLNRDVDKIVGIHLFFS